MGRAVHGLAGALLPGKATLGPFTFDIPLILESRGGDLQPAPAGSPDRAELRSDPSAPLGERHLRIVQGSTSLDLTFPVPTPEISGVPGALHEAAPGLWFVHWPLTPEDWTLLRSRRPELVVLGNARALWQEGEPFVRAVGKIRRELGGHPLLWTPRVALPHRVPFLNWMGIDLLDTTEGLLQSVAGVFLDSTLGALAADARTERGCSCSSCQAEPLGRLEEHTVELYRSQTREVRAALRAGRLRELVEARLAAEPALAEMLRYADRELLPLLEQRAPVVDRGTTSYVLREARRRPEVRRYIERFGDRYRPPPSKRLLLLVPCSRTKPYRKSRSHRQFARAAEGLPHGTLIHVVSVSSPLGLVPQELEDVYPARHYEIPVTGEWEEDERQAVEVGLDHLLRDGAYTQIVVHLDSREYSFLGAHLPDRYRPRWTVSEGRTSSPQSLGALREALKDADLGPDPPRLGRLAAVKEELEALGRFQFGVIAAGLLFSPPVRLEGRPWSLRIADDTRVDLATWNEERGLFHLTVAGGRRLLSARTLWVEVDPLVRLTGDLFTPGVRAADAAIRVGDAVLLVREGQLLGVGEAALPGPLMTELPHGLAVLVRHRARTTIVPAEPMAPTPP